MEPEIGLGGEGTEVGGGGAGGGEAGSVEETEGPCENVGVEVVYGGGGDRR